MAAQVTEFDEQLAQVPNGWNSRVHFYKYMTAATAKIVLANRTLRWSTPSLLNDPFDIQFNMQIKADPKLVREQALDILWQVHTGMIAPSQRSKLAPIFALLRLCNINMSKEEIIEEFGPAFDEGFERALAVLPSVNEEAAHIISDTKILCLTSRPDNTLMWAHYADSHRGVVLRFRSIPALDSPYGLAKPVRYYEEVPPLLDEEQLAHLFSGVISIEEAGILDRTIFSKSSHWEYEQEWRICTGSGRNPQMEFEDCPFRANELDGIVFGLRTSPNERAEILALLSDYPNVELMEIRRSPFSFDLEVHEITDAA